MTVFAAHAEKKAKPLPPPPPPPAVISAVTSAKKVFLSNAGADPIYAHDITGGANGSYNALDASLKQWGYFQLVDSPAQADLIFAIHSTETVDEKDVWNLDPHSTQPYDVIVGPKHPIFHLTILDASTQSVIWKIDSPAGFAFTRKKGAVAFAKSIDTLTNQVKALVAEPAPPQNP